MNHKIERGIGVGLVLLFLVGCGGPATPIPPSTSVIEGQAFWSNTTNPIAGVTIALYDATSDKKTTEAITDERGQYSFAEVKPGTYWMTATWKFTSSEIPKDDTTHELDGELLVSGFGSEGYVLSQAYKASEIFVGEQRPYGLDPNLLVKQVGSGGFIFAQYYKAGELGIPLDGLDSNLTVKGFGPLGFIFGQYYKAGELGVPLDGLNPDLEVIGVGFGSDGGTCFTFGTSYQASELGIPLKSLDPNLLMQGYCFRSDGQVRFTLGTSYRVGELGIPLHGLDSDLETRHIVITSDEWFIIVSAESDDTLLLIATGIEQKFAVTAGDVLQMDLDLSYK